MRRCREQFHQYTDGVQETLSDKIIRRLEEIRKALEILRRQNTSQEGQQYIELRARVDVALRSARARHVSIVGSIAA